MDFKSMLHQLSILSESTQETPTGRVHKAGPGGYGRKFDTDEEGDENKKEPATQEPKRRGRPPSTGAHTTSPEEKARREKAEKAGKDLQSFMVGNLPKGKLPGKASAKHSIKEYIQRIEAKNLREEYDMNEDSLPEFVYISKDRVREFEDWMESEGFNAATLPKKRKGNFVVYDYSGEDTLAKGYASEWNEEPMSEEAPGQQLTVKPMPGAAQLVDPASNKIVATGDAASVKNIQGAVAQGKVQMRGDLDEGNQDQLDEISQRTLSSYLTKKDNRLNKDLDSAKPQPQQMFDPKGKPVKGKTFIDPKDKAKSTRATNKIRSDYEKSTEPAHSRVRAFQAGRGKEWYHNSPESDFSSGALPHYYQKGKAYGDAEKAAEKQYKDTLKSLKKQYTEDMDLDESKKAMKHKKKMSEADIPSSHNDMGAGLGKGRSDKTLESKNKKKLKESSHKHSSAKLLGRAHALAKESYNCKYDDVDEARMYHEGYKEGLDECYGRGVYEATDVIENDIMAAMEGDIGEGNEFSEKLAQAPEGGKFTVGDKTYTKTTDYNAKIDEFAFESLDKKLNALLNEDSVAEGLSVSISQGQQSMPDTVSVTAQDAEAEQLLDMIKQAGIGLFGKEESSDFSIPGDGAGAEKHGEIDVVGDHDGMMSLIKKVTGVSDQEHDEHVDDYEDEHDHEEHDTSEEGDYEEHEGVCETCHESSCKCDEQMVETETYAQEEENVAETEEQMYEWANDAGQSLEDFREGTFNTKTEFMTDTISGGLNKRKIDVAGNGQTTIPVTSVRTDESIKAILRLAGVK